MKPEETFDPNAPQPTDVQRDSETPLAKKPSFLFIISTTIGVPTIILLAVSAYHGITH
jgi:hypothetical protein